MGWSLLIWLMGWIGWHPFFVSVTDIRHNAQEQSLEISVRIFTDDLEHTLRMHNPGQKVDLMQPANPAIMDSLIKRYVISRFRLTVDGRPVALQYVGHERVDESVWSYFEVTGVPSLQRLKVYNTLLYEYKKEQINMHHVVVGGKRLSRKLDQPAMEYEFVF